MLVPSAAVVFMILDVVVRRGAVAFYNAAIPLLTPALMAAVPVVIALFATFANGMGTNVGKAVKEFKLLIGCPGVLGS